MIIFQTAGGSDVEGVLGGVFSAGQVDEQVTTFRNNSYIHRLNRTLQAEMRAVSAYTGVLGCGRDEAFLTDVVEAHQRAGRQLVRIIIANRGIPEEKTALSVGLTGTLVRVSLKIPPTALFGKAAKTTLVQIERSLVVHYRKLLAEAPPRDAADLRELLDQAERFAASLSERF